MNRRSFLGLLAGSVLFPGMPELSLHTQMVIEKHKCDGEWVPRNATFYDQYGIKVYTYETRHGELNIIGNRILP